MNLKGDRDFVGSFQNKTVAPKNISEFLKTITVWSEILYSEEQFHIFVQTLMYGDDKGISISVVIVEKTRIAKLLITCLSEDVRKYISISQ